jgi:hypothetical protein
LGLVVAVVVLLLLKLISSGPVAKRTDTPAPFPARTREKY